MQIASSSLKLIGALAIAGAAGYLASSQLGGKLKISYADSTPAKPAAASPGPAAAAPAAGAKTLSWLAAAPGRVEPRSGEIRIGAGVLGRVTEVLVKVNDKVEEGELLFRLDDEEARARLAAAEAEAGLRKRERDDAKVTSGREDVSKAEDNVFAAERAVTGARYELDYALAARRAGGSGVEQMLADARQRLSDAKTRLQRDRLAYANAQAKSNLPAPNRAESGLTAARANVTMADAVLDKTRIRAPISGTVLQTLAKVGEMVAPGAEQPLMMLGDMSVLRVKAEIDDGDVAKIRVGQRAFVRSLNYPGRDFEGRISALAPTLGSPRIPGRGPRRTTDTEVQEVTIELDGAVPLLPGMRVDAFFRRD
jgi:HlyD family secretion protein